MFPINSFETRGETKRYDTSSQGKVGIINIHLIRLWSLAHGCITALFLYGSIIKYP